MSEAEAKVAGNMVLLQYNCMIIIRYQCTPKPGNSERKAFLALCHISIGRQGLFTDSRGKFVYKSDPETSMAR